MNSNDSSDGSSSLEPSPPPEDNQQYLPQDGRGNNSGAGGGSMNGGHNMKGDAPSSLLPQHDDDDETSKPTTNINQPQQTNSNDDNTAIPSSSLTVTAPSPSSSTYADAVMNGIHDPMNNLAVHSPAHHKQLAQQQQQQLGVGHLPQIQEVQQQPQQHYYQYNSQQPQQQPVPALFGAPGSSSQQTGGETTAEDEEGRTSRMSMGLSERAMSVDTTVTTTTANTNNHHGNINVGGGRASTPGAMSVSEEDFMIQDVLLGNTANSSSGEGEGGGNNNNGGGSIMGGATTTSQQVVNNGSQPLSNNTAQQQQHEQQISEQSHTINGTVQEPLNSAHIPSSLAHQPPQHPPNGHGSHHRHHGQTEIVNVGVGRGEATAAHEREQQGGNNNTSGTTPQSQQRGEVTMKTSSSPQHQQLSKQTTTSSSTTTTTAFAREYLRTAGHTLERLSYILGRGSLVMINFSQRNLNAQDAQLIRSAILSNPQLSVLKLGYNNLGNVGANLIAEAIQFGGRKNIGIVGRDCWDGTVNANSGSDEKQQQQQQQQKTTTGGIQHNHHPSLSVLDLGFNNISDEGCTSLATMAVARNPSLSTLYLSGNAVRESGALALAEVIAGGTGLTSLHLTANRIGPRGVRGIMRSIAEFDVTMQMAHQDRENRMALEEEKRKQREEEEHTKLLKKEREKQLNNKGGNDSSMDNTENEDVDLELLGINDDNSENQQRDAINNNSNNNNEDDEEEELDDLARLRGFKCMEELYLGGTNMESTGCLSVSNMLLTNLSLRVICLSDNGLNDQDLSLFSQSLSRNRELPLEILRLSFNKLTCVGVETLMNAIWGSKTLREIKLDNNQIRDRGAQLAAVVLTSVDLEVLDMGFNRLTIVGIKALMKSLAENRSLLTLTLSGNVLDTNASKAVSYALAYNKTIRKLYVDHCSLSYAAQRHIAAGIVSNSNLALRVMSGFPLGAISVTLGLPGAMETWSNEQVLKFIRVMWDRYRHEKEAALASSRDSSQSMSTAGASEGGSVNAASVKSAEKVEPKSGPSDPATVVAAAKSAFEALGDAGGALLLTEEPQRSISDSSPMVSSDAVMLEKTPSGTIRVPSLDETDAASSPQNSIRQSTFVPLEVSNTHISTGSLCTTNGKECPETPVDPAAKKRNMEWLRLHFRSLNEMIGLPYVYADLLQLYRYFYSPVDADDEGSVHDGMPPPHPGLGFNPGIMSSSPPPRLSGLQRKISYRGLHDVMMGQNNNLPSPNFSMENSCKRRPVSDQSMQPATKRARNGKPRIDYFPRIKAKIEKHLSSSKQTKALILLRQLKFVETTMFHGVNPYCDQQQSSSATATGSSNSNEPIATDAEVILIDML